MKLQKLYPVLVVEAVLAAACAVGAAGGAVAGVFAAPWQQLGAGLRALSLLGGGANLAAWVLYLGLCLAPAAGFWALRRRGCGCRADWLLVLLCGVLAAVLYGMINPARLAGWFHPGMPLAAAMAGAGWAVWSVLLAWLVLRLVAAVDSGRGGVYRMLGLLLVDYYLSFRV